MLFPGKSSPPKKTNFSKLAPLPVRLNLSKNFFLFFNGSQSGIDLKKNNFIIFIIFIFLSYTQKFHPKNIWDRKKNNKKPLQTHEDSSDMFPETDLKSLACMNVIIIFSLVKVRGCKYGFSHIYSLTYGRILR